MRQYRWMAISLVLILLIVTVLPVAAAPTFSEPVLLDGWVGGALALLSLILAAGLSFWMRNQRK